MRCSYSLTSARTLLSHIMHQLSKHMPSLELDTYAATESLCPNLFCSIAQRMLLLRRGLGERSPRVRAAACAMLRHWLIGACGGQITALLHALDVETYEGANEGACLLEPRCVSPARHVVSTTPCLPLQYT